MQDPTAEDPKRSFDSLGLDPAVLPTLEALGFETPTPIQVAAIPALLSGRDLIARARTGSGKTAAFGLPLLDRLRGCRPGLRALVLAPTRELALQVTDALRELRGKERIGVATIYGGAPYGPQLEALRAGVPVIVGTPGRLLDLMDSGRLDLTQVELVVVDEADEMLRQGFIDDVERLLAAASGPRQVAMFSATMPNEIKRIAQSTLKDPATIEVEGGGSGPMVDHITQRWMRVPQRNKLEALIRILQAEVRGTTLVFARTRQGCAEMSEELTRLGLAVDALHGDLSQNLRERVLTRLRKKQLSIVVATDVASRGIDVNHITHVINLDLPGGAEVYAHRIGRTGRAGREGQAITFVTPREIARFNSWGRRLKVNIKEMMPPSDAEIATRHQAILGRALESALGEGTEGATRWLEDMMTAHEWTPEQVAAAALSVLAKEQGLALEAQPSTDAPHWARPPRRERGRPQRNDRGYDDRPNRGHRDQGPPNRGFRDQGPPNQGPPNRGYRDQGPPNRDPRNQGADEVHLFLAIGRAAGVGPSDLVGALANDVGIPGARIGRISIFENKSFVGLSRNDAQKVLSIARVVNVRGTNARMDLAHGPAEGNARAQADSGKPRRKDGHAKFGSKKNHLPRKQRRK
jgi:ATP-dependent RNA helicase DeaD